MSGPRRSPGWAHLSIAQRCRLVDRVAEKLAEHPPPCFSDWGVISVGAGWRVRESQDRRVIRGRTPVLTLTVKRKLAESRLACDACIPSHWPVRHGRGESRRLIHIPIDVCNANTRVRAHSPLVAPADTNGRKGTACVLLKDQDGAQWLLSCHHVLGDSSVSAGLKPRLDLAITVHGLNQPHRLAGQRHFGELEADGDNCVDAAVVLVDPADPVTVADWSRYPHAVESNAGVWNSGARLLTPQGVIALRYVHTLANAAVEYKSKAIARIYRLAVFESLGSTHPQRGDSGSPVVSAEGKWIGMHIAGDGRWSYVIPAYVLLNSEVFGKKFRLSV